MYIDYLVFKKQQALPTKCSYFGQFTVLKSLLSYMHNTVQHLVQNPTTAPSLPKNSTVLHYRIFCWYASGLNSSLFPFTTSCGSYPVMGWQLPAVSWVLQLIVSSGGGADLFWREISYLWCPPSHLLVHSVLLLVCSTSLPSPPAPFASLLISVNNTIQMKHLWVTQNPSYIRLTTINKGRFSIQEPVSLCGTGQQFWAAWVSLSLACPA